MLGVKCRPSYHSLHSSSQSAPDNGLLKGITHMSPRLFCHSFPAYAKLKEEIAMIEVEIMHLERCLLSLYRTTFEHLPTFSDNPEIHIQYKTESALQVVANQSCYKLEPNMSRGGTVLHGQLFPGSILSGSDNPSYAAVKTTSKRDQNKSDLGHRSLADHLGASCIDNTLTTPDILSEEIVRSISSIYCKMVDSTLTDPGSSPSTSSSSHSSTFSQRTPCDSWSPHCTEEAIMHCQPQGFKKENGPYTAMIEVPKININDDNFDFAASMLQKLRSLVGSLEKIDPRKMKREGKLAFWINIHNALVMHTYLAYGTHSRLKSASILKAAYNVGGHCINAHVIQSSILGIRSHHSVPWLQTLLSPGMKSKRGSVKHIYAMEYPEPLVHFALCSGAYSDPAVRVYRARNIFQDLKIAKEEFIQASVYIQKETKIFLPKILDKFAKDMSLSMHGLLDTVDGCISNVQQKAIKRCVKERPDKSIHWLQMNSTFRYVIHRELAERKCV